MLFMHYRRLKKNIQLKRLTKGRHIIAKRSQRKFNAALTKNITITSVIESKFRINLIYLFRIKR